MSVSLGYLELRLHVPQAMNLKDKRRIVKGFKDRLRHGFNVSVAEIEGQDTHRSAVLAVAMVGTDHAYVEGALQKIVNLAASHRDMILLGQQIEWL